MHDRQKPDSSRHQADILARADEGFQLIEMLCTPGDAFLYFDERGRSCGNTESLSGMFGYSQAEIAVMQPRQLFSKHAAWQFSQAMNRFREIEQDSAWFGFRGDLFAQRKDGTVFPVEVTLSTGQMRGRCFYVLMLRDITSRLQRESQLRRMAYHDHLTGLPNRALFEDRLACAFARQKRSHTPFALLAADIDNFKAINDTLGHAAGDQVLRETAARMVGHLRETDTVARIGGDEFAVILERIEDRGEAARLCDDLAANLGASVRFNGRAVRISVSIGYALAPLHGRHPGMLMLSADRAMYLAKRNGPARETEGEPESDALWVDFAVHPHGQRQGSTHGKPRRASAIGHRMK